MNRDTESSAHRRNLARNALGNRLFSDLEIVGGLKIYPRLNIATKIAYQPERGIHTDRAPFKRDIVDARWRHMERARQRVGAKGKGFHVFLAQNLAGVDGAQTIFWCSKAQCFFPVLVGEFYIESSFTEPKS